MWNDIVYDKGGLALHAGLKVIPTGGGRQGVHDHRPVGHREDDDDVHDAERLAADPGRLRGADAGRPARTAPRTAASRRRSRSTPTSSRRSTAPSSSPPPTSRTSTRTTTARWTSSTRTTRRTVARSSRCSDLPDLRGRPERRPRRLPADPQPEREHHPGGREARPGAGRRVLHARGDDGHLRRRRRPRRASSCACRERTRSSRSPTGCRATGLLELLATHPIETYLLNTGRVGGQGRRRPLEEGEDPAHVGVREGHRRADDRRSRRTRISGYQVAAAVPEFDDPELLQPAPALRAAGSRRRVPRDRRPPEGRARRAPAAVHPSCPRTSSRPSAEDLHVRYPSGPRLTDPASEQRGASIPPGGIS